MTTSKKAQAIKHVWDVALSRGNLDLADRCAVLHRREVEHVKKMNDRLRRAKR